MEEIAKKIKELYLSPDGATGGYGQVVFDDYNLDTESVEWCIKEAKKGEYVSICEETRKMSLEALRAILSLTEDEREFVIELAMEDVY